MAHRSIFARARLAWQLLREYEAKERLQEQAITVPEALAMLNRMAAQGWHYEVGVDRWREAMVERSGSYPRDGYGTGINS